MTSNDAALEAIENFAVIVGQLDQVSQELCSLFLTKSNDESKLPTVSEALKNTNSCLDSALTSLCQCTSMLNRQMYDNLPKIGLLLTSEFTDDPNSDQQISENQDQNNTLDNAGDKSNVDIHEEITEEPSENGIAHLEEVIKNLKLNQDSTQDKLKKSESAKEHWKLECQLLQMKLTKLKSEQEQAEEQQNQENHLVQDPIKDKIDELISEKLMADSKASQLYLECLALQKRVKYWEKCKVRAEENLQLAQNDIKSLKEDASTTSLNYEDQLSLMSEHLANMNDRLTNQTDEIDRLKYELTNKKSGGKR